MTREDALDAVKKITANYGARQLNKSNEAKTRLLVVDEVLLALGWAKEEFEPETKVGKLNYLDYQLTADGIPRLIVEAKRVGHTFGHARQGLKKTDYALGYLQSAFRKQLTEVIDQAIKYAHDTRIPYAALTNGHEWILCQLLPPPGKDAKDLRCFYIGDLLSEEHHFDLLWELMSRPSVVQGSLEEGFAELNSHESEFSIEPRAMLGQLAWKPAADDPELRDFYHRFFDEITDPARRRMLEHCFVTNASLNQYQGALKRALTDAAPNYIPGAQELTPDDSSSLLTTHTGDQKGRVVLVTGSVGVGKSTFVTKTLVEHRNSPAQLLPGNGRIRIHQQLNTHRCVRCFTLRSSA